MTSASGSWPGAGNTRGGLPERIGHYKITDRIGRGAMGVVYSGRDERTGRPVALKVMMTDLEGDKETRERFNREANVAGKMVHRNIINVYEAGEEDGRLYMVMELLEGETLNDYMKRVGDLPLEHALDLMMQVCEGLAIAHAHAIVHRDIKPGNLFVMRDGGLKILDFGVARLANSSMTASGFIVGTPGLHVARAGARPRDRPAVRRLFRGSGVLLHAVGREAVFGARPAGGAPPRQQRGPAAAAARTLSRRALADPDESAGQADRRAVCGHGAAAGRSGALRAGLRQRDARHGQRDAAARRRGVRAGGVAEPADRARAGSPRRPRVSPFSDQLLDRYPVLDERGGDALGVVPFRRAALAEISADLDARRLALNAEISQVKQLGATT